MDNKIISIIIIQKYIRKFLIKNKILIAPSYYQTKEWRKNKKWYINGKYNECEKYQVNILEQIIKNKLNKTNERIFTETNEIINIGYQNKNNDNGYEFTENFDRKIIINEYIYYFNLKFVCDDGRAQTRTLKDVYHFIKYQIKYLYFINILDGNKI